MISNEYNFIKLVETQLADVVKSQIEESLLREMMSEFEVKASEIIKRHVSQITFDSVKSMRDYAQIRDEIHMYVHYNNDEPEKLTDKLAHKEG